MRQAARRREQEHERQQDQPGDLEEVQQLAPADDVHGEKREHDAAGEAAELLERLHRADGLLAAPARGSVRTSARPGTMRGICWIAPNAAPYAHAIMIVVTMVVRRNSRAEELARSSDA